VIVDAVKIGVIVFLAAVLQAAVFAEVVVLGGTPDILLVTLVAVALLRGSIAGASAGFLGGLLVDTAMLDMLGLTSLVLTLVGYWTGRFGETSAPGRRYAPYLAVATMTLLYLAATIALRFLLGEPAPARDVLLEAFFQTLALNLIVTWPVYHLLRRLLPEREPVTLSMGVGVVG
jgi:rod shape-determining protein MreD